MIYLFLIIAIAIYILLSTSYSSDVGHELSTPSTNANDTNNTVQIVEMSQRTICHLAGAPHYIGGKTGKHLQIFKTGQVLTSFREPNNVHDPLAIGVYLDNKMVGHIPKLHNSKHANHLDRGGQLRVEIIRVDYSDPWKGITLDIRNI